MFVDPDKLKTIRKYQLGLTVEALAKKAGMSTSSVWRMESGRVEVALRTIRKLALALEVPYQDLILANAAPPQEEKTTAPAPSSSKLVLLKDPSKIKMLRTLRYGFTMEELAEKANLSFRTVATVESSNRGIRKSTVHKLAQALGVSYEELVSGNEIMALKEEEEEKQ